MYRLVVVDKQFDINKNFWEDNYQLRFIDGFKQLYDRDESKDKTISSKQAWCCYLAEDPSYQNKIGKLPHKDKVSAILSFYPEFDFKDPDIMHCINKYPSNCMSEAGRQYQFSINSLERIEKQINRILGEGDLTLNTYETFVNNRGTEQQKLVKGTLLQVLDAKKKTQIIWEQHEKWKRIFDEEQGNIQLYGGGNPTLVEEGGLMMIDDDD